MNNLYAKKGTLEKYQHVKSRLLVRVGRSNGTLLCIAIPTYKRSILLRETLQSVQRQTANFDDFEVVVIDNDPDGDDGAAVELISQFGFRNFAYYRNAENIGLFGNWNRCIELSGSERLTVLHDDDEITPDYVKTMVGLFDLDPRVLLSCDFAIKLEAHHIGNHRSNFVETTVKRLKNRIRTGRMRKRTVREYFFRNPNVGSLGLIINRQCAVDMGGFNEDQFPSSDYFFFFEYLRRFSTFHLYRKLAIYRIGYNESLRNETSVGFVYKNFGFRTYIARSICRSRILAALTGPLAITEMKVIKSFWGNSIDEKAILEDLKISPMLNRKIVATCTRIVVALSDIWTDIASTNYPVPRRDTADLG